jgi:hypothetical protein
MKRSAIALIIVPVVLSSLTIGVLVADDTNNQVGHPMYPRIPADPSISSLDYFLSIKNLHESGNTNGITFDLQINYDQRLQAGQKVPACVVIAANGTTNNYHFFSIPFEGSCEIKLLDSKGVEIKKTVAGQSFKFWTIKKIYDWELENMYTGFNIFNIEGGGSHQFSPFSISQAFELKTPGEYFLHLRVRLIKGGRDASGALARIFIEPSEIVAKIQIRPEDIPLEKVNSTRQP